MQRGLEDVLIIVEGVHMEIPDTPPANQPVYLAPPPPAPASPPVAAPLPPVAGTATEADKLRVQYKAVGEAQKKVFGVGLPGSTPPDFTRLGQALAPSPAGPVAPAAGAAVPPDAKPPASAPPKQPPPPDALRRANQAAGASTAAPGPVGQAGSPPPK
jgi:hypothetical protein